MSDNKSDFLDQLKELLGPEKYRVFAEQEFNAASALVADIRKLVHDSSKTHAEATTLLLPELDAETRAKAQGLIGALYGEYILCRMMDTTSQLALQLHYDLPQFAGHVMKHYEIERGSYMLSQLRASVLGAAASEKDHEHKPDCTH